MADGTDGQVADGGHGLGSPGHPSERACVDYGPDLVAMQTPVVIPA